MKTCKEIETQIENMLRDRWTTRNARAVPEVESLTLKHNLAAEFEGAVLYADLAGSTKLVDEYKTFFAAQIYKAFLEGCCEVIRNNGGTITAFDGDRVMAVFTGESKCSDAARTGLQIRFVVERIRGIFAQQYKMSSEIVDYAVGIAVSKLFAVRVGVKGDNDIAWIGSAANHAAKLSEIRDPRYKTFVSGQVFARLSRNVRLSSPERKLMWSDLSPRESPKSVFASSWQWSFS